MRWTPWLLCVAVSPLASGQGFDPGMLGSPATLAPIEDLGDFVTGDLTGDGRPDVLGSWSGPLTNMVLVPALAGSVFAPASLSAAWPAGVPEGTLVYLQAFTAAGASAAGSNVLLLVPQP